jgi:non-ribosomal peptide synthetase component F
MVVGLAASAQSYLGKNGLVGHAVNLLPLRFKPQATQAFSSLLKEVRGTVLDAFEHQRFTFSMLLPRLKIARDPGRPPLVPVVFNIDVRNDPISPQGIDVHYQTLSREYENFELFVNAVDDGSTLCFECVFNTALYDASTIANWMRRFERMLRALIANADLPLGQLPAATEAERERVVVDFNRTQAEYTSCSIPELVAGAVAIASAKAAVVTAQRTLDYAELNRLSDALAAQLVTRGVCKGAFVALCMQRSALLPAALLGILKSGAAYLPLDPEFPKQRLHDIVSDSGARLLLEIGRAHV